MAAIAASLVLAPGAGAAPTWYDASADAHLGATTDLNDVAADPARGVVIAVGQDTPALDPAATAAPPPGAVAYRRAGGSWYADTIELPAGVTAASSELDSLAIAGGVGWAIGSYTEAGASTAQPLIVRATGLTAAAPVTWAPLDPATAPLPAGLAAPLSIALAPVASGTGADGYIGDSAGKVYPVADEAGSPARIGAALADSTPSNTAPVNGLALYGHAPASGFAVVGYTGDNTAARFFGISDPVGVAPFSPQPTALDPAIPTGYGLLSVAALGPYSAVALDDHGGLWHRSGTDGLWRREVPKTRAGTNAFINGATPARIAMRAVGQDLTLVEAVAGDSDLGGSVWRLEPAYGTWKQDVLRDPSGTAVSVVNGVAVAGIDDLWAAGAGGTLQHYYDKPVPPSTTPSTDPDPSSTPPQSGGDPPPADQPVAGDPAATGQPDPSVTVDQQPAATAPAQQPKPTVKRKHRRRHHRRHRRVAPPRPKQSPPAASPGQPPKQLMQNVAVKQTAKGLVVSFDLRAPAEVGVVAKLGGKVVGKSPTKRCPKGHGRVVVPYHGKKVPTDLKITVRPIASRT